MLRDTGFPSMNSPGAAKSATSSACSGQILCPSDRLKSENLEVMFTQGSGLFSTQGNSRPMVLHKCLALATCIRSKSD